MAHVILGEHADKLTVRLTEGDGATLMATVVDAAGLPVNWSATPSLQFVDKRNPDATPVTFVATVATSTATWTLGTANVAAIVAASSRTYTHPETLARITLPDGGDGTVIAAGSVDWRSAWESGDRVQTISFTTAGGPPGVGVPAGGTTGQVLAKTSNTDYATGWVAQTGGGGGAVSSVNTRTGAVVLTSADVGLGSVNNTADSAKPVSTAQAAADTAVQTAAATDATTKANAAQAAAIAASQPLDSDLTAIAALTTTAYGRAFLSLANQAALVGLLPSYQPLDADLTSVAALTTTAYGRAFLELSNQAALVALLPTYQPLDSDLTALAALTTTTYGRSLLEVANVAALKTSLTLVKGDVGLGNVDNTADSAKPVSTAQQTALDLKADALTTINAQTGTTYTAVQGDSTKLVTLTNAAAITVTLPNTLTIGTRIDFAVLGAGMATFVGSGGATITATPSAVTRATGSAASATKVTATLFLLVGDLA